MNSAVLIAVSVAVPIVIGTMLGVQIIVVIVLLSGLIIMKVLMLPPWAGVPVGGAKTETEITGPMTTGSETKPKAVRLRRVGNHRNAKSRRKNRHGEHT